MPLDITAIPFTYDPSVDTAVVTLEKNMPIDITLVPVAGGVIVYCTGYFD